MSSPTSTPPGSPSEASNSPEIPIITPPIDRSEGRNVHIYDANDPATVIGGLILTNGVTNANFYQMVKIIVTIRSDNFFLRDEGDTKIERNDRPLQPGKYYIVADESFSVTKDVPLIRTISGVSGSRVKAFREAVRSRDGRCVITGEVALGATSRRWTSFEAAHIFPLAYESHWKATKVRECITIPPDNPSHGTINSVQNGLLLDRAIHSLFDSYDFSVNPDDGYKIVCFNYDSKGIAGKHLDQEFLDCPQRPPDELLRWHFKQAVLINMKGAGEPVFEQDFPPGSDMVGEILHGPKAAERMEFELFTRLGAQMEVY